MRYRPSKQLACSAALLAGLAAGAATTAAAAPTYYEISITNLTDGQPLTPPIVATHRRPFHIFENGDPASFQLKEIAENGNLGPMAELLNANKHVFESKIIISDMGPPPILPGAVVHFSITSAHGAKYFSFASMLICTNDGFTGIDSLRLPKHVGDSETHYAMAYDTGTEINTEDFADIVPPCQALVGVMSDDAGTGVSNPDLAENSVIHPHPNIAGFADLVPEVHGWLGPVAEITVTRVE